MKHFAQIYLAAILLCCTSLAAASPWDDQIAQWKLESINLKSGQIPTLESQAKNGDVRATYLLYLERGQTRFKYAQSSGAVLVGELAKSIAETGNPIGMRMLCFLYREGEGGLPKNAQTAFQWCYRSGQLGLVDGMSAVANYYFYGTGTPKDDGKAFEWHQKSANANDSRGMYGVGWAYETGKGVAKDEVQAAVWYRKAADAGSGIAMVALGVFHGEGKGGLTKNDKQAFALYQKAYENNHSDATLAIGWAYENGRGVIKDVVKAFEWYKKGASLNNSYAMNALARLYKDGSGVSKDTQLAISWYEKAIFLGNVMAMNDIGALYRDGQASLGGDALAVQWFRKAEQAGIGLSMAALGKLHEQGRGGLAKDYSLARQQYEKAAAAGEAYGYTAIGEMYVNGYGVSRNLAEAIVWYLKAANMGEGIAMTNLASKYKNGEGTQKNVNVAAKWYAKALATNTTAKFNDTGESAQLRARRILDEMLAEGVITDSQTLREVKAISLPAPKAEWVVAPQSAGEEEVTFKVRVNDNGGGVGDVKFLLNGVAMGVSTGRNLVVESADVRTFTVRLPAGQHDVEVLAYNAENLINWTSLKTTVTSTFKQVRKPQLHAVVVGINQYGDSTLELNYAADDATAVAKELQANGAKLYDQVHIKLLNNRTQTGKAAILQAIKEAANRAQPEDVFIFYVAGHGQTTDRDGYQMLTADVRSLSVQAVREGSVTADELQRAVYNVPSARKVILLDTCQSGEGIDVSKLLSRPEVHAQENREMMSRIKRKSGAMVLAAAQSKEEALEGYKGHGIFTYSLLEGLEGKADSNKDGFVSTFELQEYVMKRADQLAEQVFGRAQQPYPAALSGFELVKWR